MKIKENFHEEIRKLASSIKKEFAIEVDRNKVIAEFCNLFEEKMKQRNCGKEE